MSQMPKGFYALSILKCFYKTTNFGYVEKIVEEIEEVSNS